MACFYPNLPIKSLLHQNMQTNFSPFLYQGEATKVILMFLAVADLCQLLSDFITFVLPDSSTFAFNVSHTLHNMDYLQSQVFLKLDSASKELEWCIIHQASIRKLVLTTGVYQIWTLAYLFHTSGKTWSMYAFSLKVGKQTCLFILYVICSYVV